MNRQPVIKIYISCHKKSMLPENALFVPVQGGAACAKEILPGLQRDDDGDNISLKNRMYCELTTQYWAWKNDEADYYGFCHYRRYFSFSSEKLPEDNYASVIYSYLSDKAIHELNLDDETRIRTIVEPYDLIITTPDDFKKYGRKNIYEQYSFTPHLHGEDMLCAISVLKELYPEYAIAADKYMNGADFYPCNMFIMKRDLFHTYSKWLFSILFETERRLNMENYSAEGLRTLGHIGERLLGIFYTYIRENHPEYKAAVVQRALVMDTQPVELPAPYFLEQNIPVAFCFSDVFVPYFAVTLQSLLKNISEENNYDLLILHTHVSNKNQDKLQQMVSHYKNVSLRFYNIRHLASALHPISYGHVSVDHVSIETFYRLLSNQVFTNYEKIVYLDSDIIIQQDIAELYRIPLGTNLIGAVADADFAGEYNGAVPGIKEYTDKILKLKKPYKYFQAGVLLLNIQQMNLEFEESELIDFAQEREYIYVDQDVLNVKCEDRVTYLDPRWNVMTDCDDIRIENRIKRAPQYMYEEYMKSREFPFIIHYAGDEKPWNNPLCDYADVYWQYARQTIFYEILICRMMDLRVNGLVSVASPARKLADELLPKGTRRREFAKKLLPKGSRRWNFFKKIYYALGGK